MSYEKLKLLVVSGFGDKGISELADTLSQTGKFSQTEVMQGCPWWHAGTNPHRRARIIEKRLVQIGQPTMLVGHSYGALLALAAACRRQFAGISGVFINGPLNPDVPVAPPQGKPLFHIFALHYQMREDIARECANALRQIDSTVLKNCVTIASADDNIVPPDAQKLPDILTSISLPRETCGHGMNSSKIAAVSEIIMRMICAPNSPVLTPLPSSAKSAPDLLSPICLPRTKR